MALRIKPDLEHHSSGWNHYKYTSDMVAEGGLPKFNIRNKLSYKIESCSPDVERHGESKY